MKLKMVIAVINEIFYEGTASDIHAHLFEQVPTLVVGEWRVVQGDCTS